MCSWAAKRVFFYAPDYLIPDEENRKLECCLKYGEKGPVGLWWYDEKGTIYYNDDKGGTSRLDNLVENKYDGEDDAHEKCADLCMLVNTADYNIDGKDWVGNWDLTHADYRKPFKSKHELEYGFFSVLRNLNTTTRENLQIDLKCPISRELFEDPVICDGPV